MTSHRITGTKWVTAVPFGGALLALACATFSATFGSACGGGSQPEFAEQPYPDGGIDAAAQPPPPPPVAVDAGPTTPTTGACDPVQTLAMTTIFQGRAAGEAPGMQPDGAPTCGIVPEGQTLTTQMFMLQPGHCYTFLAHGLPTVSEVDVQLIPDLTGGAQVQPALAALLRGPALAVDTDSGVQAAIGAKQSCYQMPLPFPVAVKLEVKARTGSGPVGVQAYKKKK